MSVHAVTLTGNRVTLVPLELSHAASLWDAGSDPSVWTYMPMPMHAPADMEAFVQKTLAAPDEVSFAVLENEGGRIIGSTRYLDISLPHRRIEIGGTWYTPAAQRTFVNTECKYLLLRHAFERRDMNRVSLKTDSRNLRSQRAIERLGAVREGVLRAHMVMPDGARRDTVYYSILRDEWPAARARLEGFLRAER